MKKIIASLFLVLFVQYAFAQEYLSEAKSGYTGGFNENVKELPLSVNFLFLGDWGRNGQYYQSQVSEQMGKTAAAIGADFIVTAGDNFYPSGMQSVQDPQWKYSFEDVYRSHFLQCPWYVCLGNHDYKGNIQAEIDYSNISRRWRLPSPYYSKKIKFKDGGVLLLVVIDTSPLLDTYYGKDDEMSANVIQQDTAQQRMWLVQTLSDTDPSIKWKVVVGHHPLYSGGKRKTSSDTRIIEQKLQPIFDTYKVDAYLCGHEHDFQVIKPQGHYTTQYLSGSGCEVRPSGTTDGTLFFAAEPGFMTFSATAHQLLVQAVHADGRVLYSNTLSK
jgi:tartrate-resistant acid phosphatase type 5